MKKEFIISGFGGQGAILMGQLFARAAVGAGLRATFVPSYGAEMRGGMASCGVVISDEEIDSPIVVEPDVLVAMNLKSLDKLEKSVVPGGSVIVNESLIEKRVGRADVREYRVPVNGMAAELQNPRVANIVMLGVVAKAAGIVPADDVIAQVEAFFRDRYPDKPAIAELNVNAVKRGLEAV